MKYHFSIVLVVISLFMYFIFNNNNIKRLRDAIKKKTFICNTPSLISLLSCAWKINIIISILFYLHNLSRKINNIKHFYIIYQNVYLEI
jgi:hypothetical protein